MAEVQMSTASPSPEPKVPHRRPLTVDVLLTFGSKVAVLILTVGTGVVVARALGPSGRGAIAVAFTFTLLLVQFGILGLHSANAYFASREPQQISRILTNTLWTCLGMGLALGLVGVAVYELFPGMLRGLDVLEVTVILVGIPAVLGTLLLQSLLLAEGRMVAYNGVELGMAIATFAGLAVVLLAFSGGVLAALLLYLAVNTVAVLTFVFLLRHHLRGLRSFDVRLFRSMLRYGFRLYLAALLAYVVWRTNLLLVNSYLGSSAAGEFSIAVALGEMIHLLPVVVALNLFPRIARGDEATDTGAVFRSLTLIYAAVCLAMVPLLGPAIKVLYGEQFSGAIGICYWLLPGIFAYGMVSVLSYHFAGRGFPLEALLVWFAGVAVNFAIAVPLLSSHQSAAYAAIAISAAYAVILALHMRMFAAESGTYASLIPKPKETLNHVVGMASALKLSAGRPTSGPTL
jgi:O-antigen/teichoic acid export membrane protein